MTPPRQPRRAGRAGLVIAVLAAGAVLAWLLATGRIDAPGGTEGTGAAPTASPAAGIPERPADAFEIAVEYVIDGDTIKARALGQSDVMPGADTVSVRLIGIDTPETYPDQECWGAEATDTLRSLAPEGSILWAAPDSEQRDRYDRVLLYLWTADGAFVNHELVARGDAEALLVRPNDAHAALFAADEAAARATGAGRWGACG